MDAETLQHILIQTSDMIAERLTILVDRVTESVDAMANRSSLGTPEERRRFALLQSASQFFPYYEQQTQDLKEAARMAVTSAHALLDEIERRPAGESKFTQRSYV